MRDGDDGDTRKDDGDCDVEEGGNDDGDHSDGDEGDDNEDGALDHDDAFDGNVIAVPAVLRPVI